MMEDGWWCIIVQLCRGALRALRNATMHLSPFWGYSSAYAAEECHLLQRRACADRKYAVV
jgi:hypothetical protein